LTPAVVKYKILESNMINKIDKERRHSMNAAPTRPSGKEPRRTPKKNRTGHKAEHGQANHSFRIHN
jgi:hypothetical protein